MLKQIIVGHTTPAQESVFRNTSVLKVSIDETYIQDQIYHIKTNIRTNSYISNVRVVVFKITDNVYSVKTAVAPCTLRYVEEYGLEIAKIKNPRLVYSLLSGTIPESELVSK